MATAQKSEINIWNGEERRRTPRLEETVVRIATQLENLIANFKKRSDEDDIKFTSINTRLTSLEQDRAKIWGGTAVVVLLIDLIMKVIK